MQACNDSEFCDVEQCMRGSWGGLPPQPILKLLRGTVCPRCSDRAVRERWDAGRCARQAIEWFHVGHYW